MCAPQRILEHDVKEALDDRVLAVDEVLIHHILGLSRLIDDNLALRAIKYSVDLNSLLNLRHAEDHAPRRHV